MHQNKKTSSVKFEKIFRIEIRGSVLFGDTPSFDLFKLVLSGELNLEAYVTIELDGSITMSYEIFNKQQRKLFFIGGVPISCAVISKIWIIFFWTLCYLNHHISKSQLSIWLLKITFLNKTMFKWNESMQISEITVLLKLL